MDNGKLLSRLLLAASVAFALIAYGKQEPIVPQLRASAKPAAAPAEGQEDSVGAFDASELDSSTDACHDLNKFVNSKWIAANPIPDDNTSWGAFNQLVERNLIAQHSIVEKLAENEAALAPGSIEQKIAWLYQAGMDQEALDKAGFSPIKKKLDAVSNIRNGGDVARAIYARFSEGDQQVFKFGPGADFKNSQAQIGFASQGGLGLPAASYYSDAKYLDIRLSYIEYIAKSFQLTGVSMLDARSQAAEVLALETELANASLSPTELRNLENRYHFVTIGQANKITPNFDWNQFFIAQKVNAIHGFSLSQPKFFAKFDQLLAHAPITQWKAYLSFHTIDDASPYLSVAFQENRHEFYGKLLAGQPERAEQWKRVLGTINGSMGQALGQLYVSREFTPEAKARAKELAENILQALRIRIESAEWMSSATKKKAIEKWQKLLPKIGYPDHWRSWDGLQVRQGDYYGNVLAAAKFNYEYEIGHIGKQTDRTEWSMNPQTVNAYYSRSTNTINFPAAILQPPFFYSAGDDAINYGGIGAMMGHEAIHGFDDMGRQFDGDGNQVDWWSAEDEAKFNERAARLVAQFENYTPIAGKPDLHVNGQLTLGENIADLGGLNVAYVALQKALKKSSVVRHRGDRYTEAQRFFLSSARVWRNSTREKSAEILLGADRHAPTFLRANGAPSNMSVYAETFQCEPSDPMVQSPSKRVEIW